MEGTDLAFTGFWSACMHLRCGDFFFNAGLAGDPFFCKVANITCLDENTLADFTAQFKKYGIPPYLYLEEGSKFENELESQFKLCDTQHVLAKCPKKASPVRARQITPETSKIWSEIFCHAYDCSDWLVAVDNAVKQSIGPVGYYVDETLSSCAALIEVESVLGLYCLGTVPEMRGRGCAGSLIEFASGELERKGLDFLVLETYGADNLLNFYSHLGFEETYRKKIYTT